MATTYIVVDAGTNMTPLTSPYNYRQWSQEFQIACQYRGIWRLFTDKERVDEPNEARHRFAISNTESVKVGGLERRFAMHKEEYRMHLQKQDYAMAFLAESIGGSYREQIMGKAPNQAWGKLKTLCESKAVDTTGSVWAEFNNLYQKDCMSLGYFLRKIKELREKLVSLGDECTDDQCKLRIISGLKQQFVARLLQDKQVFQSINSTSLKEFAAQLLEMEASLEG